MAMKNILLALMITIGWIVTQPTNIAYATDVSGTCTGTWNPANNPFRLVGTCTVPTGQTLTIPVGVVVNGQGNTIQTDGVLNIDGVAFTDTIVEYRTGSSGTVQNSTFTGRYVYTHGSSVLSPITPQILNNTFTTTGTALHVTGTSRPTISGNTITAFTGLELYGDSQPTVTNNAITTTTTSTSSGVTGIYIYDQAQPTLTTNTITTNGYGLRFQETAGGQATGNTITFRPEGNNSRSGIRLEGTSSPVVDGNTVNDDATRTDYALVVFVGATSTATVTNNSLCATGSDRPLSVRGGAFSASVNVSGNTFPCGNGIGVEFSSHTLTEDAQLKAINGVSTFVMDSTIFVDAGVTLTIPSGITINGQGNRIQTDGVLNITGSTFTSLIAEYRTGSSGTVQNSTFTGGYVGTSGSSVLTPITPQILNNTFITASTALYIAGTSRPTISGNTITAFTGLELYGDSQPTVTNNTITTTPTSTSGSVIGIYAYDQAQPTLTANTILTNGRGLLFQETSKGQATGNTIHFHPEGNNSRSGIRLEGTSSPVVDGNIVTDDATRTDYALLVWVGATSTASITNNSLCATGSDRPLSVRGGAFSASVNVSGNTFPCGNGIGVEFSSHTLTENAQLKAVNGVSTFVMDSTIFVDAGVTLTVPNTITINGQNNALRSDGILNINGATLNQVHVEYRTGSSGTVQNSTFTGGSVGTSGSSVLTPITPQILNNTFTTTSTALYIAGTSRPTISGNTITAFTGLELYGDSQPTVTNNTITTTPTSTSGSVIGIYAYDQAQPTLTANTILTNGRGILFQETSEGQATGNTITFRPEGNNSRDGIRLDHTASPTVINNTISDDTTRSDSGLVLTVDAASTTVVTQNTVQCSGGDTPLELGLGIFSDSSLPQVANNSFTCGTGSGLNLAGSLSGNSTLKPINGVSAFLLSGSLSIAAGGRLRIPTGVTVDGQNRSLTVNGNLVIENTVLQNLFLNFAAGSIGSLTNTMFTGPSFSTAISLNSASPSITGNTFTGMSTAIGLSGATNALIDNNIFAASAVAVSFGSSVSRATVSHNTFRQNTHSLSFLNADALFSAYPAMFDTSTFVGPPDKNTLRMPNTINVSGTQIAAPAPYLSTGTTVSANNTMVMQPGTVVQNSSFTSFVADGELVAAGTPEFPIIFTSPSPSTGTRWRGVQINNKTTASSSVLDSALIEFAGVFGEGALRLSNADIQVKNSQVSDNNSAGIELLSSSDATISRNAIVGNGGHGIAVTGSNPVVNLNSLFNNGGNGVNNSTCPTPNSLINAENNYWGDDSGPNDPSDDRAGGGLFNTLGGGEGVSNCVDYDPWIRTGPSVEGTLTVISGGGQSGMIGTVLPQPLVVEIRSTLGSPLANIDVIFSIIEGSASIVESAPIKTSTNGRASVHVQLGLTPGNVVIAVTARDVNSPLALFTANGAAGFALAAIPLSLNVKPRQKGQPGDLNNDGFVNNIDAVLLAGVLNGALLPDLPPALNFSRSGDLNGDQQITEGDIFAIEGYVVGVVPARRR